MLTWSLALAPIIAAHGWAHRAGALRAQLLFDLVLAVVLGPALLIGGDLNPVQVLDSLAPQHGFELSEQNWRQDAQSDLVFQFHPWWQSTREQLAEGRLPALDPAAGLGMPLLAGGQTGLFAPMMLPVWWLGPEAGTTVMAAWKLETAFVSMWWLSGLLVFPRRSREVAAVAFAGSPFLIAWLLVPLAWVIALAPWIVGLVLKAHRGPASAKRIVAAGVALGWLGGAGLHPESALIVATLAAGLAFGRQPRRFRRLLAIAALSASVAIPMAWPTVQLIRASSRHQLRLEAEPNSQRPSVELRLRAASQSVMPLSQGHPRDGEFLPAYPYPVGAMGIGLVGFGLLAGVSFSRRRRLTMSALSALGGLAVVLVFRIPPIDTALISLPVIADMTLPRWGLVLPFVLSLIAAAAVERGEYLADRRLISLMVAGAIAAAAGTTVMGLPLISLAAAVLGLLALGLSPYLSRRAPIAALVALELTLVAWAINPRAAPQDRVAQSKLLDQIVDLEVDGAIRFAAVGEILPANLSGRYGLHDLRAFSPLRPAPYARLLGLLGEDDPVLGATLQRAPADHLGAWGVCRLLGPSSRIEAPWRVKELYGDLVLAENPVCQPELRLVPRAAAEEVEAIDPSRTARLAGELPALGGHGQIVEARLEATEVELLVEVVDAPMLLVLARPWAPGWRAELDGEPVELRLAEIAAMAVVLPPGDHRVSFSYRPWRWSLQRPIGG